MTAKRKPLHESLQSTNGSGKTEGNGSGNTPKCPNSNLIICQSYEKINNIIYEKLKYAIGYRYGEGCAKAAKVIIKQNTGCPSNFGSLSEIGKRLFRLRESQILTQKEVGTLTGIGEKRLNEIEKDGRDTTMLEIKKLASFYKVSSDYIIFGKQRTLRDPVTGMPQQFYC